MLLMSKTHFRRGTNEYEIEKEGSSNLGQDHLARSPWTGCSQFLPTTQKIIQFSDGIPPKPTDKIVSKLFICSRNFSNFHFLLFPGLRRRSVRSVPRGSFGLLGEGASVWRLSDCRLAHGPCGECVQGRQLSDHESPRARAQRVSVQVR